MGQGTTALIVQTVFRSIRIVLPVFYFLSTALGILIFTNNERLWFEMKKFYPHHVLAHSNFAHALWRRGLINEAIAEYQVAIRLNPNYVYDHNSLAVCYYEKGFVDEAKREFKIALQLNPQFLDAYNNLGSIYVETNQYQEAIDCFEAAIRINPQYIPAYHNLGLVYTRLNRGPEAKNIWNKIRMISSEDQTVRGSLESPQ